MVEPTDTSEVPVEGGGGSRHRRRRHRFGGDTPSGDLSELPPAERPRLAAAAEALALAALAAGPLLLGGVHLPVQLGIAAAGPVALAALVLAQGRGGLHGSWSGAALLALCGAILLQLLPLPPALLAAIAPATHDTLLVALKPQGLYPGWHALTLDVPASARELSKLAGWTALFLVLRHRAAASRAARRRLLAVLAVVGAAMAAIVVLHAATGASSLFGIYRFVHAPALVGTVANRNHLAGLLNVSALVAAGLALTATARRAGAGWGAVALACAGVSVATGSRGGTIALAFGTVLALALVLAGRLPGGAPRLRVASRAAAFAAVAAVASLALGLVSLPSELDENTALSPLASRIPGKLDALIAGRNAALASPLAGIGRGAFETAHPRFAARPLVESFPYVENEPVQALAELGFPLGAAVCIGLLWAFWELARRGRRSRTDAAALGAAAALALQSFVDFSLQFAAGTWLLGLLAHRPLGGGRPLPFAAGAALAASLALAVGGGAAVALPGNAAETRALSALGANPSATAADVDAAARAAQRRHPADYFPCLVAAVRNLHDRTGAGKALPWLSCAIYLNPTAGGLHNLTGEALARLKRRDQALIEWRTAARLGTPTMDRVLRRWPDREAILAAVPPRVEPTLQALGYLRPARVDDALAVVAQTRAEAPRDPRLELELVRLLREAGREEEALAAARALREADPAELEAPVLEAAALAALGRPVEAEAVYRAALQRSPGHGGLLVGLGRLLAGQKRTAELPDLLRSMRSDAAPAYQAAAHELLARAALDRGEPDRARDELRVALRLRPGDPALRVALAEVYLALRRTEEALREVEGLGDDVPGAARIRAQGASVRDARDLLERRLRRGGTAGD